MELFSEYFKKEHLLSRVDARIKILVSLVILAMVVSYKGFALPLTVMSFCLALCLLMRIPLRLFVLRFSEPVFIATVVVILKFFFSGSEVLFSWNIGGVAVTGHRDGLLDGLMIATRIGGAVSIVAALGFSTPFTEFMAGLAWYKVPKGFIEILMFAYRYIFVLFEDAMVIYQAQKNRLGYSSMRRGLSSFGTLAGSLTIKAFDNSQHTSVAMIQRGYDGDMPMLRHRPFKVSEIVASIACLCILGALWSI